MQQTAYGQEPSNNLGTQSRTIAIIALCLFALAGLMSGFAVGAFVHPGHTHQGILSTPALTPKITGQTAVPTHTPSPQRPVNLGIPKIDRVSYSEVAKWYNYLYTLVPGHNKIWCSCSCTRCYLQNLACSTNTRWRNV